MATKEEIREWLGCCGAPTKCYIVCKGQYDNELKVWPLRSIVCMAHDLAVQELTPLHLLNETLTGIQGPTFAEWKKQKGREGKVEKIRNVLQEFVIKCPCTYAEVAHKILDAIEGEGE